jgi:methylated-DNA-protein-cysteine methyltransferase-like protein
LSSFEEAVLGVLRTLEPGDVLTYGEVAAEAGHPGAGRAVGSLLRTTEEDLPWWRVVGSGGALRSPDHRLQARLLAADGVLTRDRRVVGFRNR